MSNLVLSIGGVQANWIQHHVPWMAVLVLLFGMASEEGPGTAEIDLNG